MSAEIRIPAALARRHRPGRRHRLRAVVPGARSAAFCPSTLWARFWDDRQAVPLKAFLLAACLLAAMLLEAPR